MLNLLKRRTATAESKFWQSFQKYENALFDFERDQESLFTRLATELQRVHPDLTFEFGPKNKDGTREFVVSAGGIKSAFPSVVALVGAAPSLKCWKITAFRPRRWPLNSLDYGGKHVDADDVQFTLLDNGEMVGIYLYIPGYIEGDANFGQIGYLMLDDALGEYDVETGVGLIKMFSIDAPKENNRQPLAELPAKFDQLQAKLHQSTRLHS
jgi:hypothetical protein